MAASEWTLERGQLSRTGRLSLTAADGVRAGLALARMSHGGQVGLADRGSSAAKALVYAVESGVLQGSGRGWEFGSCFESQFGYCLNRSGADYGIFSGYSGELQVYARGGLPLSLEEETRFLSLLDLEENRPIFTGDWGTAYSMESLRALYQVELIKAAETSLSGMQVSLKCANPQIRKFMEEALYNLGCKLREDGLTLQISGDGRDVAVYESVQDYVATEKIICLICLDLFRRGQDAAVPASAPRILDQAASIYGRQVFRYEDGIPSVNDRKARSLAVRQPFLRDGLMMGLRLLSVLKRRGGRLLELEHEFPEYSVVSRAVFPAEIPRRGAVLSFPTGELRVRPIPNRKAVLLVAESHTMEAASALCELAEEKFSRGLFRHHPDP